MPKPETPTPEAMVSVPMGRWAVAAAPTALRTLLGSCVGVILHDRAARAGGLAHIVLPDSRGAADHPGKFADTAIPALLADLAKLLGRVPAGRLTAKLVGGASMFQVGMGLDIGRLNGEAVGRILDARGIPIVAREVGGSTGRRATLDTATGLVTIRVPGGADLTI